jgi:hypothetical protein
MADIIERTRPKGFNKKVWTALYKEAEADKAWAREILEQGQNASKASNMSIEWVGKCLHLRPHQLAKEAYEYLEMRAHGVTFLGALDPSALRRWIELGGKKPGSKSVWKYDHTTHRTSAVKKEGKWADWLGREVA